MHPRPRGNGSGRPQVLRPIVVAVVPSERKFPRRSMGEPAVSPSGECAAISNAARSSEGGFASPGTGLGPGLCRAPPTPPTPPRAWMVRVERTSHDRGRTDGHRHRPAGRRVGPGLPVGVTAHARGSPRSGFKPALAEPSGLGVERLPAGRGAELLDAAPPTWREGLAAGGPAAPLRARLTKRARFISGLSRPESRLLTGLLAPETAPSAEAKQARSLHGRAPSSPCPPFWPRRRMSASSAESSDAAGETPAPTS